MKYVSLPLLSKIQYKNSHENIISYKEAFIEYSTNTLCMIMEYANGGDLYHYLLHHYKEKRYLTEKRVWQLFTQVLRGLKVLYDQKILHRDIKSQNVFLTKSGYAKLGDLNVSKVLKYGMLHTQAGTPYYASPEVWSERPYDHKSDVWSLGCVLYEMCTLKPPFRGESMRDLRQKICKGVYLPIPKHFSAELNDLIKQMLNTDPSSRLGIEKIMEIPIVSIKVSEITERIGNSLSSKPPLAHGSLLDTIRMPKNLRVLKEMLPKPNYSNTRGQSVGRKRSDSSTTNEHESSKRSERFASKNSKQANNKSMINGNMRHLINLREKH